MSARSGLGSRSGSKLTKDLKFGVRVKSWVEVESRILGRSWGRVSRSGSRHIFGQVLRSDLRSL